MSSSREHGLVLGDEDARSSPSENAEATLHRIERAKVGRTERCRSVEHQVVERQEHEGVDRGTSRFDSGSSLGSECPRHL